MPATDQIVREWLSRLGILCCGAMSEEEARGKIAAYVPLLCEVYFTEAFNDQSLGAVARECKFFPSYGELCGLLTAWWRDNRPASFALEGPEDGEGARWDRRSDELRREWDDPEGIRRRIQRHGDDPLIANLFAALVQKWAPQHLPLIPPKYREDIESTRVRSRNRA